VTPSREQPRPSGSHACALRQVFRWRMAWDSLRSGALKAGSRLGRNEPSADRFIQTFHRIAQRQTTKDWKFQPFPILWKQPTSSPVPFVAHMNERPGYGLSFMWATRTFEFFANQLEYPFAHAHHHDITIHFKPRSSQFLRLACLPGSIRFGETLLKANCTAHHFPRRAARYRDSSEVVDGL